MTVVAHRDVDTFDDAAMQEVIAATRQVIEAVLVVEYQFAALAALTERFGARYQRRVANEIERSITELQLAEQHRRHAIAVMSQQRGEIVPDNIDRLVEMTQEPLRSELCRQRDELRKGCERIATMRNKAEDVLGRRIALISETLSMPADKLGITYGRQLRPRPRLVNGVL